MQVEVTDVDREAAAAYTGLTDSLASKMILTGKFDDGQAVQAFARHREAARIEGIRLGLETAANCVTERSAALQARAVDAVRTVSAIRAIDPAVIGGAGVPKEITPTPAPVPPPAPALS